MPYSHHSHSGQFCKHASGTLEKVVLEAISQGFEVFGLTEHAPRYRTEDLYPEEEGLSLDDLTTQFEAFLDEAHRLKAKYHSQITLLVGLETEWITPLDSRGLSALLSKHKSAIEYTVGSVHHVNGFPIDFDRPTFEKCLQSFTTPTSTESEVMETFLSAYFDAQYELMQAFQPTVIGHFDLCRLYNPSLRFSAFPLALAKAGRNIKYAIEYGAVFEVNAAAFRKNWSTAYPATDVLQLIVANGGRFVLSDDSHGPHAVGLNYDKAFSYLRDQGVDELWYLSPSLDDPKKVIPSRVAGNWWEHAFWKTRTHSQ